MTNVTFLGNVLDYLRSRPLAQRQMVGGVIRAIQTTSITASGANVASVKELMELRVGYHRIFYVMRNETMYLLHAYQKDSQKTPMAEIETARARLKMLPPRRK